MRTERYRSKSMAIEAVQWTGTTLSSSYVSDFAPGKVRWPAHDRLELLAGKDGAQEWVPVPIGHWLVCQPGDKSDIWPVEDAYFRAKYESEDGASEGDDLIWHLEKALDLLACDTRPEVCRWREGANHVIDMCHADEPGAPGEEGERG